MANPKQSPTIEELEQAEAQIVEQSKRIDFYLTEYSIEALAQKTKNGDYVVPKYQREFTWEPERQSRFIESVIMGLPIPFLFFWEMPDGKLEIVDGSQRLRTLAEFIFGDLVLTPLEQLTALSGLQFSDLSESRQRKIKNRSIRGIVLNELADEPARLDMFERINTGSKIANKAEIRRGALAGKFTDMIIDLSNDPVFHELAPMTAKSKKERGYEELLSRFFAYSDGLENYRDRPSDFIYEYTKKMNQHFETDPNLRQQYVDRFNLVLSFVGKNFTLGFKKTPKARTTPRSRFEAISIGIYQAISLRPELLEVSKEELNVDSWIDSQEFKTITGSDGANATSKLKKRIDFVSNKLVEYDK